MLPDYWPWMVAYHRVREPLYRAILRDLALAPATQLLDAGAGDAFYSQLFASLLGPAAQVVAYDCNQKLLEAGHDLAANVQRCVGDLVDSCLAPGRFDAVWLCRSLQGAPDPLGLLGALARQLRPGGQLIVVENDTAHYPILPLETDFEQRLRQARVRYEQSRCAAGEARGGYQAAKFLAGWLRSLGLVNLSVKTHVSDELAPLSPETEDYWRLFLAWDARLLGPFLAPDDAVHYRGLSDPASPYYLLARPGCYLVELTTVARAYRP
jgi:SAM-dependent methyltransferase